MGDPAIEAVERATNGPLNSLIGAFALAAAREALRPIREVLDKLAKDTKPPCDLAKHYQLCEKAIGDISLLVFSSEEIKDEH